MVKPGTLWRSINRGHAMHLVRTTRCNAVTVQFIVVNRVGRDHKERRGKLKLDAFLGKYEPV